MMLIPCPHCGPRNEDEFLCWSESEPRRPRDPSALSDDQWNDYIYNRTNPKGPNRERWWHVRGCRRWIVVERNTVTHEITGAEVPTR